MVPEKLKELAPIIIAYLNGKRVQVWISGWNDVKTIADFHNFNNEFRIYRTPQLVPFTFEDNLLFRDKWIIFKSTGSIWKVSGFTKEGVWINNAKCHYSTFLQEYTFENGIPCGKYID